MNMQQLKQVRTVDTSWRTKLRQLSAANERAGIEFQALSRCADALWEVLHTDAWTHGKRDHGYGAINATAPDIDSMMIDWDDWLIGPGKAAPAEEREVVKRCHAQLAAAMEMVEPANLTSS